jgi:translation initiation factor IF-3
MSASSSEITSIKIKDQVDKNLSLRVYADDFFEFIESLDQKEIVIDFDGIISTSRSFAQEFLNLMKNTSKDISLINQSEDIKAVFKAAQRPRKKTKIL